MRSFSQGFLQRVKIIVAFMHYLLCCSSDTDENWEIVSNDAARPGTSAGAVEHPAQVRMRAHFSAMLSL